LSVVSSPLSVVRGERGKFHNGFGDGWVGLL